VCHSPAEQDETINDIVFVDYLPTLACHGRFIDGDYTSTEIHDPHGTSRFHPLVFE
jgi:hypothetical protein